MLKTLTVILLMVVIFFAHLITFKHKNDIQDIRKQTGKDIIILHSQIKVLEAHVQNLMKYKALH